MTITRETLDLAAKAAGREIRKIRGVIYINNTMLTNGDWWNAKPWNPENDDGDSARLRTDLNIDVEWMDRSVDVTASCVLPWASCFVRDTDHNNDKHAALRYATLMVAAEIGRRMP